MEALEPRFLLSADIMPFTIDMGDEFGADYSLKYESLTRIFSVYDNSSGELIDQRSAEKIEYIRVLGSDGDDSLVVDFGDGLLSPLDLLLEGGPGEDQLRLIEGAFESVLVSATGAGSGTVTAEADDGAIHEVSFTGISLVRDETGAAHRIFADDSGDGQMLRLHHAGAPSNGLSAIDGGSALVAYEFAAPDVMMTLEAGDGDDVIALESVDEALVGKVTVSGGGSGRAAGTC